MAGIYWIKRASRNTQIVYSRILAINSPETLGDISHIASHDALDDPPTGDSFLSVWSQYPKNSPRGHVLI
jgi:hypothetical protein